MGRDTNNDETLDLFNSSTDSIKTTTSSSLTTITRLDQDMTMKLLFNDSNHSQICTLPLAVSTPISDVSTIDCFRSDQDIANDFFETMEQLVRNFVNRPNCLFPYYRVMRWTTTDNMEHFVTVIINRPTVFS